MVKMPALPTLSTFKNSLSGSAVHYTVRVLLVAHILATSYWPNEYVNIFQHLATRVVLAVLVVALLFWDIAAGTLLAILLVLTIQEAKSRQVGASVFGDNTANAGINNQTKGTETQESGLVPQSVYGQQQVPQITASGEKVGKYMEQIGELGISKQIAAGQGVQIVDGVPSVKVNMGQVSTTNNPELTQTQQQLSVPGATLGLGKEGYQINTIPTVNLGTEYDHPANKTISENLRAQATGFITEKNLLDAQINSITGMDGAQPPCFVASESGIWNAQGFGSIARAVDNEDCPHSFV
jgi:hypothetical protein